MWKMTEKPRTVLASKALVQEFVDMEPAPYDRPLSERRLMVYERILKAGDFRVVTWASAVCHETNNTYRVNGKHTSILLSKQETLPEFYVTVERYTCDTLQDVASLYNTFDSNLASRTNRDVNLAFASTLGMKEIPVYYIHLTVSAAANLKWNENEIRRISPAEKAEELLDRQDFIQWLMKVVPGSTRRTTNNSVYLLRSPIVTAMMATYDKTPINAAKFWSQVREETATDRDDPTRVLARFLSRTSLMGGSGSNPSKERKVTTSREMYVKCLHAWNAWRKNEPTSLNYHAKAPIPPVSK